MDFSGINCPCSLDDQTNKVIYYREVYGRLEKAVDWRRPLTLAKRRQMMTKLHSWFNVELENTTLGFFKY